ncbi:MAG: hypothetical protein WBA41_27545, partial [Rivularia sp. (in: cyanobacteria)]
DGEMGRGGDGEMGRGITNYKWVCLHYLCHCVSAACPIGHATADLSQHFEMNRTLRVNASFH